MVVGLHALVLLDMARSARPPTTAGDGGSDRIAMTIGLVPLAQMPDPRSQGADAQTRTFTLAASGSPGDEDKEAQGAGASPAAESGGSNDPDHARAAPMPQAGGGGGSKDDPWARAALAPASASSVFDLSHRDEAVLLSRVRPCLPHDASGLAGVALDVTLDADGAVARLDPPTGPPPGLPAGAPKTLSEAQAQVAAAVRACAPYRDASLRRELTLQLPLAAAPA